MNEFKIRNLKKGQSSELFDVIIILIIIFLAVMIYFLYTARYFDVHAIISENEARRHNFNLAKALLGSPEFLASQATYNSTKYSLINSNVSIEKRYYEYLVFNKSRLYFVKGDVLSASYSYPNTLHHLEIVNLQDEKERWKYRYPGKALLQESAVLNFFNCLGNNIRIANVLIQSLFKVLPLGIVVEVGEGKRIGIDIWDSTAIRTCFEKELYKYFSNSIYSMNSFPLILFNGSKSEIGRLIMQSVEVS